MIRQSHRDRERRVPKNREKLEKKREWRIGIVVGLIAAIIPLVIFLSPTIKRALVVSKPVPLEDMLSIQKSSAQRVKQEMQDGLHTKMLGSSLPSNTFYEVNNTVVSYSPLEIGFAFDVYNTNSFSIPIQNIFIDVVSFQPYDSYLTFLYTAGGEDIQTYTCNLKPKIGRYEAVYQPDEDIEATGEQYLKVEPNDIEKINVVMDSDTDGIYGIRVSIVYGMQGHNETFSTDYDMFFSKGPSTVDYENRSFFFTFATDGEGFEEFSNGLTTADDVESFLDKHYDHPDIYKPVVYDLLNYFSDSGN